MEKSSQYRFDVSWVIIGKNADWSIGRLLQSIIAHVPQQLSSEIIYVDSASTDRTIEVVRAYPATVVQLSSKYPLCASAGRFIGSQYATGKYIAFIDSDMELAGGWLDAAVKLLEGEPGIGVVSGVILEADRTAHSGAVIQPPDDGGCITDIRYAGNAAIFRREALDAAGDWNPYLISDEEPELCLRIRHLGYRVVQLPCQVSWHYTYPVYRISTLLSRRKRRLFLGYGQVVRYHLRTGLLVTYCRERGWAIIPALACLTAFGAVLTSVISKNSVWILGYMGALLLVLAMDAVRSRSIYRMIFHVFHRALILEGTIRGFAMRPHACSEYPLDVQLSGPSASATLNAGGISA